MDKSAPTTKSKVKSKGSPQFISTGGSNSMVSKTSAGTQIPGQSASMGRSTEKFAKGGPSGRMVKKTGSADQTPA